MIPPIDYRQAISQVYTRLGAKKRRMADLLLTRPLEVVGKSVAEFAARCECDQTTVVRFAQQLGFTGYAELKIALARGANSLWSDFDRDIGDGETNEFKRLSDNLTQLHLESIRATLAHLDETTLDSLAERLERAGKVMICGTGSSALAAEDLSVKLGRLGVTTLFFRDYELWKTFLGYLGENDLLILFSHSGETGEIVRLAETAARKKIPAVAITSAPRSSLARHAGILLQTECRGEHPIRLGAMTSRSVQFVVVDMITLLLSLKDKNRAWENLGRGYESYP